VASDLLRNMLVVCQRGLSGAKYGLWFVHAPCIGVSRLAGHVMYQQTYVCLIELAT